jgi:coenzyme F420-reducing hydrogenase delta subunit
VDGVEVVDRSPKSRIVAFLCSWHPLAAADNAGADGCRYGVGTTLVAIDCAGVVTTAAILRAFACGVRGILVAACGPGDCHCTNGNESCEKVVEEARALLELSGISPGRLRLDMSSDVSGSRFAELIREFESELRELDVSSGKRRVRPGSGTAAASRVRRGAR